MTTFNRLINEATFTAQQSLAVARVLSAARRDAKGTLKPANLLAVVMEVTGKLADMFEKDNLMFDRGLFLKMVLRTPGASDPTASLRRPTTYNIDPTEPTARRRGDKRDAVPGWIARGA